MAAVDFTPSRPRSVIKVDVIPWSDRNSFNFSTEEDREQEPAAVRDALKRILEIYQDDEDIGAYVKLYSASRALSCIAGKAAASTDRRLLEMCAEASPKAIVIQLDVPIWHAVSVALRNEDTEFLKLLSNCRFELEEYSYIKDILIDPPHADVQKFLYVRFTSEFMDEIAHTLVSNMIRVENYEVAMLIATLAPNCSEYVHENIPEDILASFELGIKSAAKTS